MRSRTKFNSLAQLMSIDVSGAATVLTRARAHLIAALLLYINKIIQTWCKRDDTGLREKMAARIILLITMERQNVENNFFSWWKKKLYSLCTQSCGFWKISQDALERWQYGDLCSAAVWQPTKLPVLLPLPCFRMRLIIQCALCMA